MTVAELIRELQAMPQQVPVFVAELDGIARLRHGGVQQIQVGYEDMKGLLIAEIWQEGSTLDGPYDGVALGYR